MYKLFIIMMTITTFSCNESETNVKEEVDFSNATEVETEIIKPSFDKYSRRKEDSFKFLYEQALQNDPKLKDLDDRINEITIIKKDSLISYNDYDKYNKLYYKTVSNYIGSIKDSTKRKAIKNLLQNSQKNYTSLKKEHENEISKSDNLFTELADNYLMMKIFVSERMIHSYQKNIPDKSSIVHVNNLYENLIQDSKKYIVVR